MTREDIKQMTLCLVLARLDAEHKNIRDLQPHELQKYIDEAIADLTLALEVTS